MRIDGKAVETSLVNCGVPQGSPRSPILFALALAGGLEELSEGVSYVDDCSWIIEFSGYAGFQKRASGLLTKVRSKLAEFGFRMDEATTEVAWIFASSSPRGPAKAAATR
jgi:hypothetical protein